MKISAITGVWNFGVKTPQSTQPTQNVKKIDSKQDVFVSNIAFQRNTSAGNVLKKLRNISCPYTGIKMLPGSSVNRINKKLEACDTIVDVVDCLAHYVNCMQPIEKAMYNQFAEYSKYNPHGELQDCLANLYHVAITRLKLEEFAVLDEIDRLSLNMSPDNALAMRKKITTCRQVILDDNKENPFKRRTLIESLGDIPELGRDKKILEQIEDRAVYLPSSSTSENAFIVKYLERSHQEIAKRLLVSSTATIEHILPDSKGGENAIGNFILVSSSANRLRENLPLEKFIARFPNVPQNCQKYIEQIINVINNGGLKGLENYPYMVKQTLDKESKGLIKLDVDKLKTA